ncbi:PEP/pyruvate-binding domain-containing protein [Amycolatopsis sp. EV170708-02-1]|uniref:PEP/pyruvate-binding domain-containing protein n=1 Tax=Amycolatopsis sp. EV170708-02-1 TaxID=2919322 RepID=UPI001F0C1C44|nr:PEP/pyruvate-binding domain-containing protein [Amycolatopsis sp. EV170708-02-1]UMO99514.1 PEP-utilizing enzyme [Amycolatopsis sp. EV170708-02-1]
MILQLAEADGCPRDLVGGKAANLAEMISAGFPVPEGFCITTAAYRQVVADDREGRPDVPLPAWLETGIVEAYERLSPDGPVAVRSSSTAEDLPDASFAGQYDTFLGVRGADEVLAAVRRCWASLWSDRATRYREVHDADRAPAIAVIVQRLVDAACAGVLYTANPVSGKRSEIVIDAAPGLGEAVVSGAVTPDHYLLSSEGETGEGCLTPSQLGELAAVGRRLEKHFGAPQDVEWAFDGDGELWLTQSRHITTLFPVPESAGEPRAYWSVNVYQGIDRPFTPMGASMIRERQRGMATYMSALGFSDEIIDVDGWLFWDITDGVRSPAKRPQMAAFMDNLAAPSGKLVEQLGRDQRFPAVLDAPPKKRRLRWGRMIPAWLWPDQARAKVVRDAERRIAAFAGPNEATASERLSFVESVRRDVCRIEANLPRDANTAGGSGGQLAGRLLRGYVDEEEIATVFRGVPHNPTTEMDLALWRTGEAIRRDGEAFRLLLDTAPGELAAKQLAGALPDVVQHGVAAFLAQYGCRATSEIDFGVLRWAEDPEPVFAMLANLLRAEAEEQNAETRFEHAAAAAEARIVELTGRLPVTKAHRAILARFLLRRSRRLRGLREFPKFCLMRGFAALRKQLLLVGEEIVGLEQADDVMFLDLAEVREALDGKDFRAAVARRREIWEREARRPRVPSVLLSDGTVPALESGAGEADLIGLAAAAGTVTGRARVIDDPDGARIEPGEILVAATTDPGWTPLFLTAAALVTETGGMVSHGTTVAREHGIPAVVGVPGATALITTGQVITVDGSAGTITFGEEPR